MRPYESREDYLEKILELSSKKEHIRAIDIVLAMHFSKPSVSIAMKKLQDEGLINIDENGYILLTPEGHKIASDILDKHIAIAKLFMRLGVSEKTAYEDAGHLEHDLSEETWKAIENHVKR